ncbi:hypothetical protein [Verminephrobacter aporrectodeae]|uniref:hypothetical protein n=1 Tax=Verminephrobacter aporrectodeae TaxID=1110389 RepID=UPI00223845CC|nr:hypothetical protein [Verminephrobacter aporrectodeae]
MQHKLAATARAEARAPAMRSVIHTAQQIEPSRSQSRYRANSGQDTGGWIHGKKTA